MKLIFLSVFILFLTTSLFGQSSERPETIVVPVSVMGDVSDTRKQILQNTLDDELKEHFRLIPQDRFEQVQEKVFQEMEYEECTEDQCIMIIQEILQVENWFHLQVISEEGDTQLSLKWVNLDEKRVEQDYCEGCKTRELRKRIKGLVEDLVKKDFKKIDKIKKINPINKPKLILYSNILGEFSEYEKQTITLNFTNYIGDFFNIIPEDQQQEYFDKIVESLDYDEVTEEEVIKKLIEISDTNNVVLLTLIKDKFNTSMKLDWITPEGKKEVRDNCFNCQIIEVNNKLNTLIDTLLNQ